MPVPDRTALVTGVCGRIFTPGGAPMMGLWITGELVTSGAGGCAVLIRLESELPIEGWWFSPWSFIRLEEEFL